jgi:hypothetical protein
MKDLIIRTTSGVPIKLIICDSFLRKLRGLMFQKNMPQFSGIIFRYKKDSIINTSIHMLFMNFPIAVLWVNNENIIVDKIIAHPWHFMYAPSIPASLVVEIHVKHIDEFRIGDKIRFDDEI